ncbi:DUF559 domain-containing protein [Gracilibacillus boraciitolerans]|uniref:DUF559 domain-containing protein n=1 Tax=Gracilibacillus boraciitolerans TaxID=307521 RepID=UPI0005585A72|nr:DUF559 domain-containing protein [Gracilibacillus boraciitolerans]
MHPKFYPNPADWQLERIIIDKEKDELANNNGYKIIRFWEDDIINNFDYVKSIILDLLATTQLETVNVNAQKQQVKKDNQQPSSFKMEKVQRPSKPHVIRGRK